MKAIKTSGIGDESFEQETRLKQSEYSVNIPTRFCCEGKWRKGWINVTNPFRGTMVLGAPGSGKSFAVVNTYIKQLIAHGNALYVYDYKFPDLTRIVFNHYRLHPEGYSVKPQVYIVNFDDLRTSHRCNPVHPALMTDISEAYESACAVLFNLNRAWAQQQDDFCVKSVATLLAATIWYLKLYQRKRCTFPHAVELLNKKLDDVLTILTSCAELEEYLSPFMSAWGGEAHGQLQQQVEAAKMLLSSMISPPLYWVMSGNDFTLDINNPQAPKVLCVGGSPSMQARYAAALGLYSVRVARLINKPRQHKCAVVVDELPSLYFHQLDHLLATCAGMKIAICLSLQDFSQLEESYGRMGATAIMAVINNVFSGQVAGSTAEMLSTRLGIIPASKIAALPQGTFVGSTFENFKQTPFHAAIAVDADKIKADEARYAELPIIYAADDLSEMVDENFVQIQVEASQIVEDELRRIGVKQAGNGRQKN
ncbi:MAG: type IV secretory system conjugative DNA transfer family protein [Prevotellaceae bacterium]|jgi:hypothetical protein|nr:type IV secretory system conjugative DNA transfer family protein [Prevotellaceae bacterium]